MTDNMGCEKPPRKRDDAFKAAEELSDQGRTSILQFLSGVDVDFWKSQRKEQIRKLLEHIDGTDTTQKDISKVMGVSEKTVSKTKYQLLKDGNVTPKGGRPSTMTEVFPRVRDGEHQGDADPQRQRQCSRKRASTCSTQTGERTGRLHRGNP